MKTQPWPEQASLLSAGGIGRSPSDVLKVKRFFDFCQTAVLASWVKAEDQSFDPRSFVGIPVELAVSLSGRTMPGGKWVWEAQNALAGVFNDGYAKYKEEHSSWKAKPRLFPQQFKAGDILPNDGVFTIVGWEYGTRSIAEKGGGGDSVIFSEYLKAKNGPFHVNVTSRSFETSIEMLAWTSFIPALVECGWFPADEFIIFERMNRDFAKALKRNRVLKDFEKFTEQARNTAQIMLAEADEFWLA